MRPESERPIAPALTLRRRWVLGVTAVLAMFPALGQAQTATDGEPSRLAFAAFEIIDDQPDAARLPALQGRAARAGEQLAQGLQERGLYRVVDLAPAQAALARARDENEFLHRCNGCLQGVGEAAGAGLVAVGWVQRVSNLILNLNLAIWRTADDQMVLTKSVDIRGDNDESWRRGIAFMLRDMGERRARQPMYGR